MGALRFLRSKPYGPATLPGPGVLLAGVAAVLLAAAGGWLAAAKLASKPAPLTQAAPVTVQAGQARLVLRAGWQASATVPKLPGLDGATAHAYAPSDGSSGRMIFTLLPRAGATDSLPKETVAALRVPLGNAKRATVGGVLGVGYTALALRGVSGLADVYTVQTPGGTLAVSCVAPIDDPLPVGSCPGDVLSATVPPIATPDAAAALKAKLPAVMSTLNTARSSGRTALRSGALSPDQAAAARGLWHAYGTAAATVAAVAPKSGAGAALAPAFRDAARAYRALATAATRHDTHAWALARRGVNAAEQTAAARVDALRK
jgi:hypothetical protein